MVLHFTEEGLPSCGNFGGPRQSSKETLHIAASAHSLFGEYLAISLYNVTSEDSIVSLRFRVNGQRRSVAYENRHAAAAASLAAAAA